MSSKDPLPALRPNSAPPGLDASPSLFRSQVLAERQAQYLGTVLLTPPLSHRILVAFAAVAVSGLLTLLYCGDFTRKARVSGWLVPEAGWVRVFAPRAGVVVTLHVHEGESVHKGDPLLTISDELQSTKLGATRAEVAHRLAEQHDSLVREQRENAQMFERQRQGLARRLETLRAEQGQIAREIELQKARVDLAERSESRLREMRSLGYISEQQLQQTQESRLDQIAHLAALERERITALRERLTLQGELQDLPVKAQAQSAASQRNMALVEQELAETEAQREIMVPAPQDGTVTAIQAEAGGHADTNVPLLSIVPSGAVLEAHLYSPSRSVGFIRPGQQVLLRYQAYPFQKFGQYEGTVVSISRSPVSPGELPPQLSGLATLFGAQEPVYRITVHLASQTVSVYGRQLSLQPGMQLDADVALERRRLYEWMLDPLYTITGKWRR